MTHEIAPYGTDNLVRVRISERMVVADQRALEAAARRLVDDGRQVRVLITLVDFQGWQADPDWDEGLDFDFDYASRIEAIAIVGDEQWRQQALLFVGSGFRRTKISYFPPSASDLAEHWVKLD